MAGHLPANHQAEALTESVTVATAGQAYPPDGRTARSGLSIAPLTRALLATTGLGARAVLGWVGMFCVCLDRAGSAPDGAPDGSVTGQ